MQTLGPESSRQVSNLVTKYAARMQPQTESSKTDKNLKSEVGILGFFIRMVIPTRS